MNAFTTDLETIREALLNADVDDIEAIGTGTTALAAVVAQLQRRIEALERKIVILEAAIAEAKDTEAEEDDPLDDGDYAYDTWKDRQLTG